jgi:hypothetical protein
MRNFFKLILMALMIVLVLPACKKYPEGPALSFRSKKSRLVNQWTVEQKLQNGIDVTLDYKEVRRNLIVEFKEGGDLVSTYTNPVDSTIVINAAWEFNKDKSAVNITQTGVTLPYTILKLKNKELWLKTTIGATIEEFHYMSE